MQYARFNINHYVLLFLKNDIRFLIQEAAARIRPLYFAFRLLPFNANFAKVRAALLVAECIR
jgi:hypothetical protein